VSEDTFEALGEFKGAGDTWNDVLTELIERSHRLNRRELLDRTADDEYVPLEDA
jgi:predicted CopG family antitoxin